MVFYILVQKRRSKRSTHLKCTGTQGVLVYLYILKVWTLGSLDTLGMGNLLGTQDLQELLGTQDLQELLGTIGL